MPSREDDLLLFALLAASPYEDEPEFIDYVYRRLRERLRQTESSDPMIEELLLRRFHRPHRGYQRQLEIAREAASSMLEGFRSAFEPQVTERVRRAESRIAEMEAERASLAEKLKQHDEKLLCLTDNLYSLAWLNGVGANIADAKLVRYVPARFYVSDPQPNGEALAALARLVLNLAQAVGFDQAEEFPEESGSWWKRFFLKTKEAVTQKEVAERLGKAERALEVIYLDKPQAEANKDQAEAASSLINSLNATESACIQVGSLLVVKATQPNGRACVVARTLTVRELRWLEENQTMLRDPQHILDCLQNKKLRD